MRIQDLLEGTIDPSMPHIFLDMDGVQCDFEGAWLELLSLGHVDEIHDRDEAIMILSHSSAKEVYEFFKTLSPLPGGLQLVSWLKMSRLPFTILSAPLRGPYSSASIKGKKEWLSKYNPGTKESAIFINDKYRYAMDGGRPNVLIDDYPKQLSQWGKAGGIAIAHVEGSTPDTILKLKDIFKEYLSPNGIMYAHASA